MKNAYRKQIIGLGSCIVLFFIMMPPYQVTAEPCSSVVVSTNLTTSELQISIQFPKSTQRKIETEKGTFTLFETPGAGHLGTTGKPQLPIVIRTFALPSTIDSCKVTQQTITGSVNVGIVYPAQLPQTDGMKEQNPDFVFDEKCYSTDRMYPEAPWQIIEQGFIRDVRFVKIGFYPVQYNPKTTQATLYKHLALTVTFSEQASKKPLDEQDPFFTYYPTVFSNWEEYRTLRGTTNQRTEPWNPPYTTGCEYLIITHPSYTDAAKIFADWKNKQGIPTWVVNLTQTGWHNIQIKQYIQDAYDTWNPRPAFILLIGDANQVGTNYNQHLATDYEYTLVSGNDYIADLFIGRISVDTSTQANTVIQKIIRYEQNPPANIDFYSHTTIAAYFQDDIDLIPDRNDGYEDRRFIRTSEEIRDYLLQQQYTIDRIYYTDWSDYPDVWMYPPIYYNDGIYGNGELLPEDLSQPNFAWDGNADDITSAINEGRFLVTHRDHGGSRNSGSDFDGWGNPQYSTDDFNNLSNGEKLPVVFSINCQTGWFDGETDQNQNINYESFCEEILRKPEGGAVAAIGASRNSLSGYNDYLLRGFYDAIWPGFDPSQGGIHQQPIYRLGAVLNYGKLYMDQTWEYNEEWNNFTRLHFRLFHLFGDPTMEIGTQTPASFEVTHPAGLRTSDINSIPIIVRSNNQPVADASICLWKENEIYCRAQTNQQGLATLYITASTVTEGPMYITVTKHNHIPYQSVIFIDNSPPSTNYHLNGNILSLLAIDQCSGVAATVYSINDPFSIRQYTRPFALPLGRHDITYYSIDNANNREPIQSLSVQIKVRLLYPNGGEILHPGLQYITWESGDVGVSARLYWSWDAGRHWSLIEDNITNHPGINHYIWVVSHGGIYPVSPHNLLRVELIDINPVYRYDTSDNEFTIGSPLHPPDNPIP